MKFTSLYRSVVVVACALALPAFAENNTSTTITGPTVVNNNLTNWYLGYTGTNNTLTITGGGQLVNVTNVYVGYGTASLSNTLTVTGAGSVLSGSGDLVVGRLGSAGNLLSISAGGTASMAGVQISTSSAGSNNTIIVAGPGSSLSASATISVGTSSYGSLLLVSNGGRVTTTSTLLVGNNAAASSNLLIVDGVGSYLASASTLTINGSLGEMTVRGGGVASSSSMYVGQSGTTRSNTLVVAGRGSVLTNSGTLTIGSAAGASFNRVVVTNGGTLVDTSSVIAGLGANANSNTFFIGSGGMLESTIAGATVAFVVSNSVSVGNWISNSGGIYQFTKATPSITSDGQGSISLVNGTISFRGITNANVMGSLGSNQIANIRFAGTNTFRLNNASNTGAASPQNYTFASGISPSNYAGLEMINGGTAWKSSWLNVGSGGSLLVSNSAAAVDGVLTNSGTIRVVNGSVNWNSNVVLSAGSYTFAAATNTFSAGLQIDPGATFGGSGRIVNNATLINGGTISPGNSPGTLNVATNLTLLGSSTLVLEIGTNSLDYDRLIVEGTFTKGGTAQVVNLGYTFTGGEVFDFIDATNWAGSFSLLTLPTLSGGMTWNTSSFETMGILSIVAIPEPSVLLALGASLGLLAVLRRQRA